MTSGLLMSFWGFPAALIIPWSLGHISSSFDMTFLPTNGALVGYVFSWLFLYILGFLQWFVVLPCIAKIFERLAAWSGRWP